MLPTPSHGWFQPILALVGLIAIALLWYGFGVLFQEHGTITGSLPE
jgi:hypothetical protein